MDDVFLNYPQVLDYFQPQSYLDIGANKGQTIEFIIKQLPSIKHIEMIEACESHRSDLEKITKKTGFPHYIEVLSDSIKSVKFFLDNNPDRPNGSGNSYYPEDSIEYPNFNFEERITTTLDIMYPNQQFDLIKMDTQGSELDIIKGGMNLISKAKGLILEENVVPYNIGAPLSHQIKEFLENNGWIFVKHLKWWGGYVSDANGNSMWHEEVDSFYIHNSILSSMPKLPISVGILSWHSDHSLKNTLESYKRNGLFDVVSDVTILFQEVRSQDRYLANQFNIPYIGLDKNVGIGKAFVTLCEQADHPYVLLLEDDWELSTNIVKVKESLSSALKMIEHGTDVVRLRSRKNPGYPLYSQEPYYGKELEHYDPTINLISPHLFESIHWIENPEEKFPNMISTEKGHYITTSRWSNWTNNPCLYKKRFYIDTVNNFINNEGLLLEPEISYWWARQNYKIAWADGLFTHNDIDKYR